MSIIFPKLYSKDTKKYGKGMYAGEDIEKGRIVHLMGGVRMDVKDLVKKVNSKKENIDDPFQIGKRTYIDLDEVSRTFNHSCDPSVGIRKNSEMFALRDIKKDEQLTYDYSLTIAPTTWSMECVCGSNICRKKLGDIKSIPQKRLEIYKKLGCIQTYMKKIIKEIENDTYVIPKYELSALDNLEKTYN